MLPLADSWPTPNERVTANMGYRTHEFHVWEYAYFEYTAIGFMINLWSPVEGGKGGSFAVAYLYRDASVPAAQVTKLWPVNNAYCRGNVLLWAYTFNVGSTPLPSDAGVYFYVQGPGVDRWIDGVSVAGWNARSGAWCSLNWAIPNDASGSYYYFARVYSPTQGFLSPPPEQSDDWQAFIVSCP